MKQSYFDLQVTPNEIQSVVAMWALDEIRYFEFNLQWPHTTLHFIQPVSNIFQLRINSLRQARARKGL